MSTSTLITAQRSKINSRQVSAAISSECSDQIVVQKHYFDRGKSLPVLEEGYWQIRSGFVRTMSWDVDRHANTLGLWSVNNLISHKLTNLVDFRAECLSVVQAEKVTSPVGLVDILIQQHCQIEELLHINQCRDLEQRLIRLLFWLASRFGSVIETGDTSINLRLSHRIIAESISTTRVTVTRLMNRLEEKGFVQNLPKQQVIITRLAQYPNTSNYH